MLARHGTFPARQTNIVMLVFDHLAGAPGDPSLRWCWRHWCWCCDHREASRRPMGVMLRASDPAARSSGAGADFNQRDKRLRIISGCWSTHAH